MKRIFLILLLLLSFSGCTSDFSIISSNALDVDYLEREGNTISYDGSVDITGYYLRNGLPIEGGSAFEPIFINTTTTYNDINTTTTYNDDDLINSTLTLYDIESVYSVMQYDNDFLLQNVTQTSNLTGTSVLIYTYDGNGLFLGAEYE